MEKKYDDESHSLKAGAMAVENIESFLENGMTLRLACLKPNGDPLSFHAGISGKSRTVARTERNAGVPSG